MSCTITPSTPADVKIDILLANEAWNRYRMDHYGMSSCKIGYDYKYLADMKLLLTYTNCAEESCHCYCNCSGTKLKEAIYQL